MLHYTTYIKILSTLIILLFGSTFIYSYIYSKYYPIPLTSRISLDAKLMFIRDMPNREDIDTIVMGSSIGLNNVNGPALEKESKTIKHLLNLSAYSMEISHTSKLVNLFSLFPNLKRVIYSAQSLDFTGITPYEQPDMQMLKEYIQLGKNSTNFKFISYTFKNFINIVKRRLLWKETHLQHNSFLNLDFDYTGSAGLHIYGKDIIKRRWNNPFVVKTNKGSYIALEKMIKALQKKHIKFYLFLQPYRIPLVKNDPKLRSILHNFHNQATLVVNHNHENILNLHKKLHLKDKYFADRIHMNDTGNVIISKEISKYIDAHEKEHK